MLEIGVMMDGDNTLVMHQADQSFSASKNKSREHSVLMQNISTHFTSPPLVVEGGLKTFRGHFGSQPCMHWGGKQLWWSSSAL